MRNLNRLSLALILVCTATYTARAQEEDVPRFEVGAQFSSLTIQEPTGDSGFNDFRTEPGFGGRFTVNLTRYLAAEAEGNFSPNDNGRETPFTGGRTTQGLFGVKAGKRYERFGIYGKVRPGFVRYERTFVGFTELPTIPPGSPFAVFPPPQFRSRTEFATDVGVVLEFYPTRRIVTRFDIGDTIIRYKDRTINMLGQIPFQPGPPTQPSQPFVIIPAALSGETRNNFQFSAGIGFRF